MPELPEVETVRTGLAPWLDGAVIEQVELARPDLRFPFPENFAERLRGRRIDAVGRRAKYLLFSLSGGLTWLSHLGMTGRFFFSAPGDREADTGEGAGRHEHMRAVLRHPRHGREELVYADARRFGFMSLFAGCHSPFLAGLGPEPLGNGFNAAFLAERLAGRNAPIKTALMDQRLVAGLGNIYASEALHRARILPTRPAASLLAPAGGAQPELEALVAGVRAVLGEAIAAGGSTLRDFRNADGGGGYFQHNFAVYDREGAPCPTPDCSGTIERIVQSGRATYYCAVCQH